MRQRQPAPPNYLPHILVLGVLQMAVALVVLVLPANVFDGKPRLLFNEPARDIYSFAGGQGIFALALLLLVAGWIAVVLLAGRLRGDSVSKLLLGVAVGLSIVFAVAYPSGSRDMFHNIADARTLWVYSQNPMTVPPEANIDRVSVLATTFRENPGPYGPLFYVIEGVPVLVAQDDPTANILAFKAMNAGFLILLAVVVAKEADRLAPGRKQQAFVAVAWNPFILYDSVTNGHNDVMMATFIVLGLIGAAKSDMAQSLAFSLGAVLIKYAAVPVVPLTLWWWWRARGGRIDRLVLALAAGFGIAFLAIVLVMLWRGEANLAIARSILLQGDLYRSAPWLIDWVARQLSFDDAKGFARIVSLGILGSICLYAFYRVREDTASLYRAAIVVLAALIFFAVGRNFPWYAIWFLPIGFMLPGSRMLAVCIAISAADLLFYAYFPWGPVSDFTQLFYVLTAWALPVLIAVLPEDAFPARRRVEEAAP